MTRNLFTHIIWKNAKSHLREMRVLILCVTVLISAMYAMLSGFVLFSEEHSYEEVLLAEDGISRIFVSAGFMLLLCGIVLIIVVLFSYLGKRIPDYIFFQRMGISREDRRRMIRAEGGITYLIAIALGFVLGTLLSALLRIFLRRTGVLSVTTAMTSPLLYLPVCAAALFIFFIGFLLVREIDNDFQILSNPQDTMRTEKLIGMLTLPKIIIGLACCVISALLYATVRMHESAALLVLFVLGLYLMGRNTAALCLHAKKKSRSERYYRNLIRDNGFYQRLNSIARYILFFTMISVLACFYLGFHTISILNAQNPESLYPYDFMCIAGTQDRTFFSSLEKQYQVKVKQYPMVRVSNIDKTEHIEHRGEIAIQGQQIGISESTYHALKKATDSSYKKKDLHLDDEGKSVYIVHQQDASVKAQPINWSMLTVNPILHVGLPALSADTSKDACTYAGRTIAGQEICSLTGCFSTPKCENLVVFSDAYFRKAQSAWKEEDFGTALPNHYYKEYYGENAVHVQGPDRLVLIKARTEDIHSIDAKLQKREKQHLYIGNYDPTVKFHYSARTAVQDMKTERAVRVTIGVYFIALLFVIDLLMLYAMLQLQRKEKKIRERFLSQMGMPLSERSRILRRELSLFYTLPSVALILTSAIFFRDVCTARMYSATQTIGCGKMLLVLTLAWVVLRGVIYMIMMGLFRKEIRTDEG